MTKYMKAAWIWQPCKSANPVKYRRDGQKLLLESDLGPKNLSYLTEFYRVACFKSKIVSAWGPKSRHFRVLVNFKNV